MFSLWDLDLIIKVIVLLVEYLLTQWMDFLLTCKDISLCKLKSSLDFGDHGLISRIQEDLSI